ncbi:hypothetical protein [Micromonospora sp. NPDC047074]|uniref:hypothetical protein n=1 Tax=Micromonospora sp. NPDC047074 TaxID=3154339 RepID=UPI0033CECCA0
MRINLRRAAAATAAVTLLTLGFAQAPAQAATTWSTTGVAGAHAQGTTYVKYSYVYVKGYVKDTACDGKYAQVTITFVPGTVFDSPPRTEKPNTKGHGCGFVRHFTYRSHLSNGWGRVTAYECRRNSNGITNVCGPRVTIWKS